MDVLCDIVRTHLSAARGLDSLRLQNHLYGCYLLLEDIVEKNVTLSGTLLQRSSSPFDLQKQFSEIGLRYGFAMDTQLLLRPCPVEYRDAWITVFTTVTTLEQVDELEGRLNDIIQQSVPSEDGFFASTAQTGTLPPQWVERALSLLLPHDEEEKVIVKPDVVKSAMVKPAMVEPVIVKPNVGSEPKKVDPVPSPSLLEKHKDNPKRMFASTRRKKVPPKKLLATTRRKSTV